MEPMKVLLYSNIFFMLGFPTLTILLLIIVLRFLRFVKTSTASIKLDISQIKADISKMDEHVIEQAGRVAKALKVETEGVAETLRVETLKIADELKKT